MAAASGFDFTRFMTWYRQAGTPKLTARGSYDAATCRYTLTLAQSCAPTAGLARQENFLIPVAVGLVGPDGEDVDLGGGVTTRLLHLVDAEQSFVFENIPAAPVPSLLRDFSAPVTLDYPWREAELMHLMAYDRNPFNRWEAAQRLFGELILKNAEEIGRGEVANWPEGIIAAARQVLNGEGDPAFIAEVLTLPSEATLAEQMAVVDPEALHSARCELLRFLASGLQADFCQRYHDLTPTAPYRPDAEQVGRRRLRNLCLAYLVELELREYRILARQQFDRADNMSDQFAALAVLANTPGCESVLADFHQCWRHEALVVDKWLAVQAGSRLPGTLARVQALTRHPDFDLRNPNKVYALLRSFGANHRHFHAADGSGYAFLAAQIALLDAINPQVAARLARCFDRWRRFDGVHQTRARTALKGLLSRTGLSRDVLEVVEKALGKP